MSGTSVSDTTSGAHTTLWLKTAEIPSYQSLGNKTIDADVCVVGAGFAGLSTAYSLALEGKKVVVLESRELISGESGRTTAHLMSALDDRFYQIKRMHGAEGAKLAAQSHIAAVDIMESNIKRESIDCDFTRLDAYLFSHESGNHKELDEELPVAIEAGHTGARMVDKAPIPNFDTGKAILFPQQGQLHPIKYLNGLAKGITSRGGQIYTHTHATECNGGDNANVKTRDGGVVLCKDIVVCTCNPIANSWSMIIKQEAYRSYVIVGTVPKGSVPLALYWDTQDPYHYARLSPKDDTSDWLIVGGEDHRVGLHPDNIGKLYENLEKWTRERFPNFSDVTYKWSGEVWEPMDLLGFIGHNPAGEKNVYIITGDSGTGLTHTTLGAKIVTDMIMGRENAWAKIYDPTRRPSLRSLPQFVRSGFEVATGYLKWLKAGDVSDIEDIKPCSGAVVLENRHYVAVYKDEGGKVNKCSAVCTHLGGLVNWNNDEKSWDCPCHGSRFDRFGKVISGPANKDLPSV